MLILDFVTNLITSWPFVILVIVIFFHKQIGDNITKIFELITRVKSFSTGNTSINFSDQLANIDHDNKGHTQQENILELKPEWGFTSLDEFEKLASLRPDFAILDSWQPIEKRLSKIAINDLDFSQKNVFSPVRILHSMMDKHMISQSHYHYIREISSLRNQVVHNNFISLTYTDALAYRNNCIEIMQILDSIRIRPHQENH